MEVRVFRVVVVEDDTALAAVAVQLLESRGYAVRLVQTGAEAREIIAEWHPDIIILDIRLPDMSGIEILREIAARSDRKRPGVIAVSGYDDADTITTALELGAADFIRKPFVHREFILRVNALMQLREYRVELEEAREGLTKNLGKLSRYFSREVLDSILDGRIAETLSGELTPATVMFFDLRNSTSHGEQMVPGLFFQFITSFFGGISDIVYRCGGSISKFTGDGFLATFGLHEHSDSAAVLALTCSLQIRDHMELYNKRKPPYLKEPVGYGIGIATGPVYAGNVGSRHKLEYTVFGDTVNLAARLEAMTKRARVDILVDERTRAACGERLKVRRLQTSSVKGKSESVTIYYPETMPHMQGELLYGDSPK